MYVEAPKEDLAALTVLSVVDVFVMLMVVFGTCSWSFSEVWDIHATHYTFKTGGLELVVLGLVRCVVSALCASQSRAGLVTIDSSGRVHGSGVAAAATLLSALSTAYAIVKLAVCARGAATAWAPALATLLLAGTEAVVLLRVRRAVRTIASDTLKDR
ncbi:hypothetical protein JKP88DRAFT_288148 [Tribonema minus]|uniref:Uncharacterized protein n=1 Tax=Tribonema minus TaxID=303371 RepID=A0A835Z6B3_9STRA|nr:hypothetical protein JKP88DRAFT_288148 [Tribonema minus]